ETLPRSEARRARRRTGAVPPRPPIPLRPPGRDTSLRGPGLEAIGPLNRTVCHGIRSVESAATSISRRCPEGTPGIHPKATPIHRNTSFGGGWGATGSAATPCATARVHGFAAEPGAPKGYPSKKLGIRRLRLPLRLLLRRRPRLHPHLRPH